MKEVLITSSVLIVVLLLLRLVFAQKVSRRLIYAAWLLVAVRLLVPVQIGELNFSVLTATQSLVDTMAEFEELRVLGQTENDAHKQVIKDYIENDRTVFTPEAQQQITDRLENGNMSSKETADYLHKVWDDEEIFTPESREEVVQQVADATDPVSLGQVAAVLWICGVAAMAVWFLLVNLRNSRKLLSGASRLDCESPIPVYVSEQVESPCLVGLLRPRIYLTPASTTDGQKLRHVLTHEMTHYAHKDHIWSLVRCLCLCVYWFHPLVWAAAFFSRRDCELACDEGALKRLGEAERIAYGKTLLEEVSHAATPGKLLQTATAMSETKKQLKERIQFIVKRQKISVVAVIAMVLICTIVTGCVVAGPTNEQQIVEPNPSTSTQPSEPASSGRFPPVDPVILEVLDYSLGKMVAVWQSPGELIVNGVTVLYSWANYNGILYATSYNPEYSLIPVKDSDRYLQAYLGDGLFCRIDVQTGEVWELREYFASIPVPAAVCYSSDGNYAVASYANRFCTLINCVTGEITELPFEADVYAIEAMFVDNANLLLHSRHDVGTYLESSFAVYHIPTGECTQIPGRYQSKYYDQDNFLKVSWDGVLYKFTDGQLTIIDPLTWRAVLYPFGEGAEVSYYRDGIYRVVLHDVVYLLYEDGTYRQVGKEIEGPIVPPSTEPTHPAECEYVQKELLQEATCALPELVLLECIHCGDQIQQQNQKDIPHDYDKTAVTKKATCRKEGERSYVCSVCGKTKFYETIPISGEHDFVLLEKEKYSKTFASKKWYRCGDCGMERVRYYGKDGDYDLEEIYLEMIEYITQCGFDVQDVTSADDRYQSSEYSFSHCEMMGGPDYLREKIFASVKKWCDSHLATCEELGWDPSTYTCKLEIGVYSNGALGASYFYWQFCD